MKERGMIFNGEMVRAILDGRKTQTRRIVTPQPLYRHGHFYGRGDRTGLGETLFVQFRSPSHLGDRIWVRETWQGPLVDENIILTSGDLDKFENPEFCEYAAEGGVRPEFCDANGDVHHGWRPSVHMPRWASRITLEITGVRVERLHDISDEDAEAEGVDPETFSCRSPSCGFLDLWESIYGLDNRKSNPWVWVIEFKVVSDE
ncbi:morphogenetic protein [Lonsdalea quercina]|uniref:morphogenetic protein n=1 Tax=Lonsdalea quercina TaxID=71657 RepID=UPI003977174C